MSEVFSQSEVNSLVCSIDRSADRLIPSQAFYQRKGATPIDTAWGVGTSGMLLFNGISDEGVDPYYPAAFGRVRDPSQVVEKVDWCIAHPQQDGILHTHIASPCMADPNLINTRRPPMSSDIKEFVSQVYNDKQPKRSVLGISKDGRVIYTPFHSNGQTYKECMVDVCNGLNLDGQYVYISTLNHPYIMGCYGPGSSPIVSQ